MIFDTNIVWGLVQIFRFVQLLPVVLCWSQHAFAEQQDKDNSGNSDSAIKQSLTVAQLFALADAARAHGDFDTAGTAYRALARHSGLQLRTEARFRLGMMLADNERRYREAAVEFRRILDETPHATRVRLELARMNALLGEASVAQRELRSAAADGLPPEVAQTVRFYTNALEARRKIGGGFEIALAPDSNVNRATRSSSLTTCYRRFYAGPRR